MFDQLLSSFQTTLKQAKKTSTSLSRQMKQAQSQFGITQQNFHDPTKILGKVASFPKSERFKPLQKQQPRTTDSFFDSAAAIEPVIKKGVLFPKSERFISEKQDELTIINPNYNVVKKNNTNAPKIVPLSQKQMGKSRLSQATAASQTEVGPGKYFVNDEQIATGKKTPSFSKSKRFEKPKIVYEDNPLFIKQDQTKKRPPSMAVLKKKIVKNAKQISIEQQQDLRQRLKIVYWKSIPLELDRLLKKQNGAPVLKQKYFDLKKMNARQRKCAIMMLLDRLDYQRRGFDQEIKSSIGEGPCQVAYRKSTPKPFKFSEMDPGPDYYYPLDDLIRPNLIGYTFGKQEQKPKAPDNRDYQINDDFMKKGGNILIMPEHKNHVLTQQEIRALNRGPGFYDCLFSRVEKRADIGVLKFQPITQKNARENNCVEIKQVNDGVYFPSYEAIDPKIAGPVYSQPANVRPAHIPDKELFPEHWLFYDGDLNKVRAQIAKNVLIGNGLSYDEYQKFKTKLDNFKRYMQLRRQQAQFLKYDPKYDVIDPHVEGFDMSKKPQKTLIDPIVKPQFDADGDNLLLEPEKLKKKLPDIKFQKMVGRQEEQIGPDDDVHGDVLIINPKKPEKHIGEIDFKKMVARPEIKAQKNEHEQPAQGDRIILNPVLPEKKLPNIDFSKQSERPGASQDPAQIKQEKQQLFILPEKPKKIKGFVEMERMTSVRLVPVLRKKRQESEKASVIKISKKKRQQKQNLQQIDAVSQNEQQQQT